MSTNTHEQSAPQETTTSTSMQETTTSASTQEQATSAFTQETAMHVTKDVINLAHVNAPWSQTWNYLHINNIPFSVPAPEVRLSLIHI